MAERPILFSGPMVRAILDGTKRQTRRVVKPQPDNPEVFGISPIWGHGVPLPHVDPQRRFGIHAAFNVKGKRVDRWLPCPYGAPGDRLWVRETQRVIGRGPVTRRADTIRVRYEADGAESALLPFPARLKGNPEIGKCLAYGGYRESSRITLAIESVRVERLHDISEEDARAEGAGVGVRVRIDGATATSYRYGFERAWRQLNGKESWDANPWVWVISFRRLP